MIPGAGSSGIAATTWAAARRSRTHGRSDDGNQSVGTLRRLNSTASPGIHSVDLDNDKRCCIGLTIAERFEIGARIDWRAAPDRQRCDAMSRPNRGRWRSYHAAPSRRAASSPPALGALIVAAARGRIAERPATKEADAGFGRGRARAGEEAALRLVVERDDELGAIVGLLVQSLV
jgi:hypothetical protein